MIPEVLPRLIPSLPSHSHIVLSVVVMECGRKGRGEKGQKKYILKSIDYIYAT